MAGESFTLHLNDYFVEQQQGRTLDITLSYGYRDVLALEEMPDYRLVQMLVEGKAGDVIFQPSSRAIKAIQAMQQAAKKAAEEAPPLQVDGVVEEPPPPNLKEVD